MKLDPETIRRVLDYLDVIALSSPNELEEHALKKASWVLRERIFKEDLDKIGPKVVDPTIPAGESVEHVIAKVAQYTSVPVNDILGARRYKHIVRARSLAAWMLRQRPMSFPAIGHVLGSKDHTTVMSAVRRIERQRATDPELALAIEKLTGKVA